MAIYKRPPLLHLVSKVKLWPSKRGILHGVKKVEGFGSTVRLQTHCNKTIVVKDSRRGRAARWLRNRWTIRRCELCRVPKWKVERFSKGAKTPHLLADAKFYAAKTYTPKFKDRET